MTPTLQSLTTPVFSPRLSNCCLLSRLRSISNFRSTSINEPGSKEPGRAPYYPSQTTLRIAVVRRGLGHVFSFDHSLGVGPSYARRGAIPSRTLHARSRSSFYQLYFGMLPHRQPLACAIHRKPERYLADRQRLQAHMLWTACGYAGRACISSNSACPDSAGSAWNGGCHGPSPAARHPDILRSATSDRSPPVPRASFTFWATDGADPGSAGSAGPTFAGPAWAGCFWIGALPRCMGAVNYPSQGRKTKLDARSFCPHGRASQQDAAPSGKDRTPTTSSQPLDV
jgi:hypothetical protein